MSEKKQPVLRTLLMSYGMVTAVTIISIVAPILLGRDKKQKQK